MLSKYFFYKKNTILPWFWKFTKNIEILPTLLNWPLLRPTWYRVRYCPLFFKNGQNISNANKISNVKRVRNTIGSRKKSKILNDAKHKFTCLTAETSWDKLRKSRRFQTDNSAFAIFQYYFWISKLVFNCDYFQEILKIDYKLQLVHLKFWDWKLWNTKNPQVWF